MALFIHEYKVVEDFITIWFINKKTGKIYLFLERKGYIE